MPKSGSTLAFNLTRAVLEDAGVAQDALAAPGAVAEGALNFVEVIRPNELDILTDAMANRDAAPVAIKTHSGLWGCVERALAAGGVQAQAVCRDPRDVALSMMDAAKDGREWGRREGRPIRTPADALPSVKAHIAKFTNWAAQPHVLTLTYDRVAFDTEAAASDIAAHLGVTIDARRCARAARNMRGQFNKGVANRWTTEMSDEDSALYEAEFGDFITRFIPDAPERARKTGFLRRLRRR